MADKRRRSSQSKKPPPKAPDAETGSDEAVSESQGHPLSPRPLPFPVVGIGASAGGLEAYGQLLRALPSDTGMAFVLVSHLAPQHASMLAEILGRATKMPVAEVKDEGAVEPNHVYVIPPGRSMTIRGGRLNLRPRPPSRTGLQTIDEFFNSLAEDQWDRAIGVVLSGTSNDGTQGLADIKAYGGITFAQDETAQHDGMPRNAIMGGHVDFVLSPEGIAAELARIARHSYTKGEVQSETDRRAVRAVLQSIQSATGVDFSQYKTSTVVRRVHRRMALRRIESYDEYLTLLRTSREEIETLYRDILINVTSFFRNPESYEYLKQRVLPRLLHGRDRREPLRIWVLGCSTGEEAYSIAIVLTELADQLGRPIPAQIFATDLNLAGIEKARVGLYSRNIVDHVSPERLRRYFHEVEGSYRVSKAIREMCIFARHDGLHDPPFSRLDLVSCRNLMIYLEPPMQQKLLPLLHYALRNEGTLWLGSSESTGSLRTLFETEEPRLKFYRKRAVALPAPGFLPAVSTPPERAGRGRPAQPEGTTSKALFVLQKEADRLLVNRYAPPGVLLDPDLEVVQFRGDTGRYLAPAPGKASLNLLRMLREGLLVGVRSAIAKARKDNTTVRKEKLRVKTNGGFHQVDIEVIPLRVEGNTQAPLLLLFHESGKEGRAARRAVRAEPAPRGKQANQEVARLNQELASTREYLQSVIEQQEAANEELQSANEEIQSANEELQSINEELETSKEEIQSSSEELTTVNDELQNRNLELAQSNNDLLNLLSNVQMAIVILGSDRRIRRFTPTAERTLNLSNADIGRSIEDVKLHLDVPDLVELVDQAIETVSLRQREVLDRQGRWQSLRIRPYKTADGRIQGAVLLLVDIDSLKRTEISLRTSEARLRLLTDRAPVGLYELNSQGQFQRVNDQFCAITGYTREQLLERRAEDLIHPDDQADTSSGMARLLAGEIPSIRSEKRYLRADGSVIWVDVQRYPIVLGEGNLVIVGLVEDISERKAAEETTRERQQRFRELANAAPALIWIAGRNGYEFVNRAYLEFLGARQDQVVGEGWKEYLHPAQREAYLTAYQRAMERSVPFEQQVQYRKHTGEYCWMMSVAVPRYSDNGEFAGLAGSMFDITSLKEAQRELEKADQAKNAFIAILAHELRNPLAALTNGVELAFAADLPPEKQAMGQNVLRRQLASLNRMLDDLLDASRVTQGKIRLQKDELDVQKLIQHVLQTFESTVGPNEMPEVSLDLPREPIYLWADPVRMEQVLNNLLTNAFKFSSPPRHFRISAADQDGCVMIRVADNGQGIARELLPHVFELFMQGDQSTRRRHGGLGIGLALSRRIAELHGGTLTAASEGSGQGSEFTLSIPKDGQFPAEPQS